MCPYNCQDESLVAEQRQERDRRVTREGDIDGSQILGWTNVVMDTAEVVALGAVLWLLLRLDRKIATMLRVIRRIDRRTAEPTKRPLRRQAGLNEAPPELTGNRQPELDRMVAD